MRVVSVLEAPERLEEAIAFFQNHWASEASLRLYEDCIRHSARPLPQWYLLLEGEAIVGGAGLIPNDFISRADLYPWLCALIIEPAWRGRGLGARLIARAKEDAYQAGFPCLYLATDHEGYYERYGFDWIGTGYDPWGGSARLYRATL